METEVPNYYLKVDRKAFYYPEDFLHLLDKLNDKQKFTVLCLINTGARINEIRHLEKKISTMNEIILHYGRLKLKHVKVKQDLIQERLQSLPSSLSI